METHREKSKPSLDNHIVARSLGFVAAIIAVPAFIISIPPVQSALFNSSPEIQISLVNEIPVFDVLRPIPGLKVLYEGELLTPTRRSIVASRIRIENIGGKSLTPANISPKDPLGFSVENGKIIRLNKVRSNSPHLRKLINVYTNNKNVTLNYGLIFDPKDYIEFDILILKSSHQPLTYDSLGKVSEQESIDFINETSSLKEKSFAERIFSGKISDQIIKIFVYSFIGFGFITIIGGLFNFAEYSLRVRTH